MAKNFDVKFDLVLPEIFRREGVLGLLVARTLYAVGNKMREYLFKNVYKGKPFIKYYGRTDKLRRSKVKYQVYTKPTGVRVSIGSYPGNFFERGRRLRNGKRQQGLFVFSKVLPPQAEKILQSETRKLEKTIEAGA